MLILLDFVLMMHTALIHELSVDHAGSMKTRMSSGGFVFQAVDELLARAASYKYNQ